MWFFELCDMMHKLTLTSIVGFFDVYAQMPLALCVVTFYSIVILARSPYVRKTDDQLHLFVQTEIFLIIDAGMILFNQNTQSLDEATDVLLSALLIFLCCCLFILFLIMFGFSLRKLWRLRIRNKVLEAQRKALISSGAEPDDTMPIENAMGDKLLRKSHSKTELQRSRTMSHNPAYDPNNASPPQSPKTRLATDAGGSSPRVHLSSSPRQQKMAALLAEDNNGPHNTDDIMAPLALDGIGGDSAASPHGGTGASSSLSPSSSSSSSRRVRRPPTIFKFLDPFKIHYLPIISYLWQHHPIRKQHPLHLPLEYVSLNLVVNQPSILHQRQLQQRRHQPLKSWMRLLLPVIHTHR